MNTRCWGAKLFGAAANAISSPPGEYVLSLIHILLPLTMKGYSALLVTIVLILICNLVTFFLIDGIQIKDVYKRQREKR